MRAHIRLLLILHSYGPQGAWVIYSSLLRLIAENEESYNLEQSLFNTIGSIIADDEEHFPDLVYDDDCSLSLKDFTEFVLVPFVAVSLIADDVTGFDIQDAIFERNNSHEFGELFNAEDDSNEQAHDVHRQNMLAIRSQEREKEEPIPSSAPPRHRKSSKAKMDSPSPAPKFKAAIRLPASFKPIADEEITIDDFKPPQPKEKEKKEKRDKDKGAKVSKASKPAKEAANTSNPMEGDDNAEPRYGTRSRGSKQTSVESLSSFGR
ncbi:hypothetical protein B0H13DRAFT_2302159 [Mycena leptocephala]|nr:hypothetical protein B0H13DRAFT_2302159 [Mycena leptocephala]